MKPRLQTFIVVAVLAVSHGQGAAVMAQSAIYAFGAVEGGVVRTDRSLVQFDESSSYSLLPNSAISVDIQPGENDFFVLEFDAACHLKGALQDYLSLQVRLNGAVGGVLGGSLLQPQDNPTDLRTCPSGDQWHSVSKSWAIRLSNTTSSLQQRYTFSIWVRVVSVSEQSGPFAHLDNRTVRLTRYN